MLLHQIVAAMSSQRGFGSCSVEINRKERKIRATRVTGNLNIPGCKNLLVPKYSQHQKKFYNIPGGPISAGYPGTVFTALLIVGHLVPGTPEQRYPGMSQLSYCHQFDNYPGTYWLDSRGFLGRYAATTFHGQALTHTLLILKE